MMDREKIAKELSFKTDSKIILLVIDGLGGLPRNGKTELETAHTPNLDRLAAQSVCGLTDPVFMGITPGSGPAHLALFGYDPTKYLLGRGILEAIGLDIEVGKEDLVARGNFATLKRDIIVDRRAGRIPTNVNDKICQKINASIQGKDGTCIVLYPGKEHRFVVKFSGKGLSDELSDADPQKEDKPRAYTKPLSPGATHTAEIINAFLDDATAILHDEPKANTILLRGFSKYPSIPSMKELYKLSPVAIANYPMYKGLARLVGMDVLGVGPHMEELFSTVEKHYKDYDFFYVHVKKTDSAGEDGNFEAKVQVIEEVDGYIPRLLALQPAVLVVTSDHSTPCQIKGHSWHPNPFLLFSSRAQVDHVTRFSERDCANGYLGRFHAVFAMPLMMAHAGKLKKFGA
ncbi:MAG: 2,3-bisphosphoglycerate-independent phosphoglycerate mutase [Acidobacteriota bacterium]|nr:2,3-bisphosphoglycerate-independent phosphoglycerate mutase [Acidobacteriota bacterium]